MPFDAWKVDLEVLSRKARSAEMLEESESNGWNEKIARKKLSLR